MKKITVEELGEYRLTKITYGHGGKEHKEFEEGMNFETIIAFTALYSNLCTKIRRRNIVADWVWAPNVTIENLLNVLDNQGIRYKITDHTDTYYTSPEKISALREEIDQWMEKNIDFDTVLDRIAAVGVDGISRTEKRILDKKSKTL
jgi:hypothetical protein